MIGSDCVFLLAFDSESVVSGSGEGPIDVALARCHIITIMSLTSDVPSALPVVCRSIKCHSGTKAVLDFDFDSSQLKDLGNMVTQRPHCSV